MGQPSEGPSDRGLRTLFAWRQAGIIRIAHV